MQHSFELLFQQVSMGKLEVKPVSKQEIRTGLDSGYSCNGFDIEMHNVKPLVVGLLPFPMRIELKSTENLFSDSSFPEKIKTIRDLVFLIRSKESNLPVYFFAEFSDYPCEHMTFDKDNFIFSYSNPKVMTDFCTHLSRLTWTEVLEEPALQWQLESLKKTLVLLSSPVDKQLALLEPDDIPLSMSADFDCFYLHHRDGFIDSNLLKPEQVEALDRLDAFFKELSWESKSPIDSSFWEDREELSTNPNWEQIRVLAKRCLEHLGISKK